MMSTGIEMTEVGSVWIKACKAAENTPTSRNRYVDLLRAISITAVVIGHWLVLAPIVEDGQFQLDHLLSFAPWTAWLTWGFQVMPIFFMVGGFSNAASWESALRNKRGCGEWIATRLHRLVGPVVLLVLVWLALGVAALYAGIEARTLAVGSRSALIPTWFLSVYIMVVVAGPLTYRAFQRSGALSFWILVLCATAVDAIGLAGGYFDVRWFNYAFVWLAVHQLGYMWHSGRFARPARALLWAVGGLAVLLVLVNLAGYPIAMISIPGEELSNSSPPTIALIALAMLQGGLLLSLEGPMRRQLQSVRLWAATILVNRSIMTIYLWHMTVLVLVIGLLYALGGIGLAHTPGSSLWWSMRPLWLAGLATILLIVTALLFPLEQKTPKG